MGRVVHIKKSSDNLACLVLMTAGAGVDMSSVTRVQIHVDDSSASVLDSESISMTWASLVDDEYPIMIPASEINLVAGTYRDCHVKIFDGNSVDGLWWPDPVTLVVED